ncbi:MAG: DNA translocase FtsK [Candidatus Limnocylindrus sp.]
MARQRRGGRSGGGRIISGAAARTLIFLACAVTGVVLAVGLVLPGRGLLADALRDVLAPWFGAGRWLLPPALIAFGVWFERSGEKSARDALRALLAVAVLPALLAIIEIVLPDRGGIIGAVAGGGVASLLTPIGGIAAWGAIIIGIGLILAEATVRKVFNTLFGGAKAGALASADVIARGVEELAERREQAQRDREAARVAASAGSNALGEDEIGSSSDAAGSDGQSEQTRPADSFERAQTPRPSSVAAPALSSTFAPAKEAGSTIREGRPTRSDAQSNSPSSEGARAYTLPDADLLTTHDPIRAGAGMDHAVNSQIIVSKLASFGISTQVVGISAGPVVTQYELEPDASVRVSKIEALADDLAMALSARSIRIEAPIPGRSVVGIEIPNRDSNVVGLKSIFEEVEFANSNEGLTFALGRDVAGVARATDLTKMPHMLIAGATGSGKSVMVNALITSLLFRCRPDELRLILIDPKRVELSGYNGLPHLLVPVITEAEKASAALRWTVHEMENRYRLFAEAGARNIASYNEGRVDANDRIPFIVVIIDELADLMMQDGRSTEEPIVRIAQKARATGIHLVLATQRPSVNVVTGLIKANIPSRIAFSMASQIDSRTVLDAPGAEDLIGRGDMLFQPSDAPKPIRLQGVFVSDQEIEGVVNHWRAQGVPDYQLEIIESAPSGGGSSAGSAADGDRDRLFDEAVAVIQEHDRASASLLQRRLRIGYARAARIIDQLEAAGFIGAFDGSNARVVHRGGGASNGTDGELNERSE